MNAPLPHAHLDANATRVQIEQVALQRGKTQVFRGLDLQLTEQRIGLIGDNGAGKTSLLRLLCGLDAPQAGSVRICGVDIHTATKERAQLIGLMFQNPDDQIIYPVVEEEIALSLRARGLKKPQALAAARELLAERGLSHWADRAIGSLSQGQRQQVCWLALKAADPRVLLLDEPFASLDLPSQNRLADDMAETSQQVIVSTHVLAHIQDFDRVIWLEAGAVRADGSPQEVCAAYEADVALRDAQSRAHRAAARITKVKQHG